MPKLTDITEIMHYANLVNAQQRNLVTGAGISTDKNTVNPEVFYSKILLDTLRYDADQFVYYKMAETTPIQNKADELLVRRWSSLAPHTVPLREGIPPLSDRAAVKTYVIPAKSYGRYMEFSDHVDFKVVDPVLATYSKEYSTVALETLNMLAREQLIKFGQKYYAGFANTSITSLTGLTLPKKNATDAQKLTDARPKLDELRAIILDLKKKMVKPRQNGNYVVICSPEFMYDMLDDPRIAKMMEYNKTTEPMYSNTTIPNIFNMTFMETPVTSYKSNVFVSITGADSNATVRGSFESDEGLYFENQTYKFLMAKKTISSGEVALEGVTVTGRTLGNVGDTSVTQGSYETARAAKAKYLDAPAFAGKDLSAIPDYMTAAATETSTYAYAPQKVHACIILGKDALIKTGLQGEDSAKMFTKEPGSSGVLDPINQRQSIGFKINSVGFGVVNPDAVAVYYCIPTQLATVAEGPQDMSPNWFSDTDKDGAYDSGETLGK